MNLRSAILFFLCLALSASCRSEVFVHWSNSTLPPATSLGIRDVIFSWNANVLPLLQQAHSRGYQVYVETQLQQAGNVAEKVGKVGVSGIILNAPESARRTVESDLPRLRSDYPKLQFMVLYGQGKLPQMRGSLVIKDDSVLEVSSPTSQPWIDTNLSLLKVERTANDQQTPLYTFSWGQSELTHQRKSLTAIDYALAVAEAGAFHANLILNIDEDLQKGLNAKSPSAWKLWKEVLSYFDFYSGDKNNTNLQAAANVAVVVDDLDPGDEAMNLMARHNIPFEVLRAPDLQSKALENFDLMIVFAKPDEKLSLKIAEFANRGKMVVLVEAHGAYPWQKVPGVPLNAHATSYAVGSGEVIEFSEAVSDPEIFAQDIRRLLGKNHALISLWNGLTTIAVPYGENGREIKEIEFINYAADPVRVQVQVKGSFASVQYQTPGHRCCESFAAVQHDGFTEFIIPELLIAGRVHLIAQ
jgi:hypothetical protein